MKPTTMDFEELQKSWKAQRVEIPQLKPELLEKLGKSQHKLKRNAIIVTILFALVFVDFTWVYVAFGKGHTLLFGGSILMMGLVMLVFLWVVWKGVGYENYDASQPSTQYIDKYLQKLRWQRKTITHYMWVYVSLLWLAFMFYCYDITAGGSVMFRVLAPLIITVYIFGMSLLLRFTKKKKQLKKIDDLVAEMEAMKGHMG